MTAKSTFTQQFDKTFVPSFKEKGREQYYYNKAGEWIRCRESKINFLLGKWAISDNPHRYTDEEGFLIYGNYQ